jgi:hypothetical protein
MPKRFAVYIDDNYHYTDESERSAVGSFNSMEEALEKCKEITISSLSSMYEAGISAEKLSAQWSMFGDDPFIRGGDGSVPFSARKFITPELCQAIIDAQEK